jgi:hypothetical protein
MDLPLGLTAMFLLSVVIVVLICISVILSNVEQLSTYLLTICVSSLEKHLIKFFLIELLGVFAIELCELFFFYFG